MKTRSLALAVMLAALLLSSCGRTNAVAVTPGTSPRPSLAEHAASIAALRPPKRSRPVIAVLADNAGTETTDFIVPYGVLIESGVADVVAVAPEAGPIQLMTALTVEPQQTTAAFDQAYPLGADYVIVPAMYHTDSPAVIEWIRAQSNSGATIVGICSGARVLGKAGLLAGRSATTHWFDLDSLERENPELIRVDDRRYVVDRGVVTTTGVTASVPISLALVEAIAGQ